MRAGARAILNLALMQDRTFRLSVIAGSITRITQGAQPFLLPLMMQVGFGFSAVHSGLITVATAIGSLAMKGAAPRVLRAFGFRRTLVWNGVIGTAGYAVCGLFGRAGRSGRCLACWCCQAFSCRCSSPPTTPSPMTGSPRRR
jgi:hypothetical protein